MKRVHEVAQGANYKETVRTNKRTNTVRDSTEEGPLNTGVSLKGVYHQPFFLLQFSPRTLGSSDAGSNPSRNTFFSAAFVRSAFNMTCSSRFRLPWKPVIPTLPDVIPFA